MVGNEREVLMLHIRLFDPLGRGGYNGKNAINLDDMAFIRNFLP